MGSVHFEDRYGVFKNSETEALFIFSQARGRRQVALARAKRSSTAGDAEPAADVAGAVVVARAELGRRHASELDALRPGSLVDPLSHMQGPRLDTALQMIFGRRAEGREVRAKARLALRRQAAAGHGGRDGRGGGGARGGVPGPRC